MEKILLLAPYLVHYGTSLAWHTNYSCNVWINAMSAKQNKVGAEDWNK